MFFIRFNCDHFIKNVILSANIMDMFNNIQFRYIWQQGF